MDQHLANMKKGIAAVRRFLDPPLDAAAPPIEIRAAVLDAIERQVAIVGIGERVFPHGLVSVRVLLPDPSGRVPFERVFADFEARLRERLGEMRCELPAGLAARVTFVKTAPAAWADGQRFAVDYAKADDSPAPPAAPPARPPTLAVEVLSGTASKPRYTFDAPIVLIGRTAAVVDTRGRVRRNHIAFDQEAAGISRAHARIVYDPARREYRLLDDGSAKGTRLVRGDVTTDVRPRHQDARGLRLEDGDEIHLAGAALRITFA
jgi:hypothetical protein